MRRLTLAAFVAVLLAGCASTAGSPGAPAPVPAAPSVQRDGPVRAVRMTSGRAFTYVQPETAAQILCQIVDKSRLERLLDDHIGRFPSGTPAPSCMISGDRVGVTLRLRAATDPFIPAGRVAGRPVTEVDGVGQVELTVALTDDALGPPRRQVAMALLDLSVDYGTELETSAQRGLAVRVLDELVPQLVQEGDQLPGIDPAGVLGYVPTPLTRGGQIVDLPRPIQALQLCTLLREPSGLGLAATATEPTDTGSCRLSTSGAPVTVALTPTGASATSYPEALAGRPAQRLSGGSTVLVRLRDDAQVDLSVTAPDPAALAEQLVPLLLG
ncbi:MAG: hypothetical protein ACJ72N_19195 [Labedaea sp.]